ncbi:MAG: PAS domain-containing protein, partial [Myxococcales bacterium]|nr:PAS domain-containing protein [Myxococcales bacterium]
MNTPSETGDPESASPTSPRWATALEHALETLLTSEATPVNVARALARLTAGVPCERAYVALPQQTGSWLTRPEWSWSSGSTGLRTRSPREFKLLERWSETLTRGQSVVAASSSLAAGERTAHNLTSFRSLAATPLRSRDALVGALVLERDSDSPWRPSELAALRTLAVAATTSGFTAETRGGSPAHGSRVISESSATPGGEPRESAERRALDSLPQLIAWKDRQLRYLGCNRAMARALGFVAPSQVVGKRDEELGWHREQGEEGARARALERAVIDRGQPATRERRCEETPAGGRRWLDVSRAPMIDERGKVVGVVAQYEDFTSEAELEEMLRRARRLEALGTFAAGIDHDLAAECSELRVAVERGRELVASRDDELAGELA